MRHLIVTLLLLASMAARASVDFQNSEFTLTLGRDWVQVRLFFAEHFAFHSKALGVAAKIMTLDDPVRPQRTHLVATKLLEEHIRRWRLDAGASAVVSDQTVNEIDGGTEARYRGLDRLGRSSITIIRIKPMKSAILTFEAVGPDERNLELAVRDVLHGFAQ